MHIRDGILSPEVCLATGVLAFAAVGYSLRQLRHSLADRTVPLTGALAAVIFAGQMVNFPLFGLPVSGHLLGGVLAATLLGPHAACIALTLVLVVQAILFADGGLLSLGANVLNMAVIGGWGGGAIVAALRKAFGNTPRATIVAAVIAAYLSVLAAAGAFCAEFALSHQSGPFDLAQVCWWMVLMHALIGIGEAGITGGVLSFIALHRPDLLLEQTATPVRPWRTTITAGLTTACAVAALLAPWASSWPDGLEAVGQRIGFEELGIDRPLILSDYALPLPFAWEGLSVALAGILGTFVVWGLGWGLSRSVAGPLASTTEPPHAG